MPLSGKKGFKILFYGSTAQFRRHNLHPGIVRRCLISFEAFKPAELLVFWPSFCMSI